MNRTARLSLRFATSFGARLGRDLKHCERGVSIIEFAVIAPVFLILLIGLLDIGHMVYSRAVLNGAVQKAARSSSLETANTSRADAAVRQAILPVVPNALVTTERLSYFDFNDIGRPESWNDANGDGICNDGESYVDENGNEQWDSDVGASGNGGANDVVLYRVNVTYAPIFRIPFMSGTWAERTITSTAVKKNQPFASQNSRGSTARTCSD